MNLGLVEREREIERDNERKRERKRKGEEERQRENRKDNHDRSSRAAKKVTQLSQLQSRWDPEGCLGKWGRCSQETGVRLPGLFQVSPSIASAESLAK